MRYVGVDLHKTNFVACFLGDDDTARIETFALTERGLATFTRHLLPDDHLAVEAAQNVHYFYGRIRARVHRVVVVDTYKFAVIAKSKKKTDHHDAATLARFLKLGWLPTVPVPNEHIRTSGNSARLERASWKITTKLKNMAHGALTRNGLALRRAAFLSPGSRQRLAQLSGLASVDGRSWM